MHTYFQAFSRTNQDTCIETILETRKLLPHFPNSMKHNKTTIINKDNI